MKLSKNNSEIRHMWRMTYAAMVATGCTSKTSRALANKAALKYQKKFHGLQVVIDDDFSETGTGTESIDKDWLNSLLTDRIIAQRDRSRDPSGSENEAQSSLAVISELEHLREVCCK